YLGNSVKGYGGDEGLTLRVRSLLPGGLDLRDGNTFYYCSLAVLGLKLYFLHRFIHSRFGRAVRALRDDEVRAEALGLPVFA
ncbi:MAG: branched-chain amino acid transporter permease, partial [Ramlibacter sp.]|nr:branched-chain amino acid transporter permease [Ramlibacter sp.]